MKKDLLTIVALGIAFIALSFAGCQEEEEATTLQLDTTKTATIKVYAQAQLDLMNDTTETTYEVPPVGTKVTIRIDNSEFSSQYYTGQSYTVFETTTDQEGTFSYTVPATDQGTNITISLHEFIEEQKQITWDSEINDYVYDEPVEMLYTASDLTVFIYAGETKHKKIIYTYSPF